MIINKVIKGVVVQHFDTELKRFTEQRFTADEDNGHIWEHPNCTPVELETLNDCGIKEDEPNFPTDMIQPTIQPNMVPFVIPNAKVVVIPLNDGSDPTEEFMGKVVGTRDGKYIQVKDQDDNVFDCEPRQVHYV